jgi:hypothetical protein
LRASERPLRATGPEQERSRGEPGSVNPIVAESRYRGAEWRITRSFCLQSSVPCMPAGSEAENQVTWNHFLFVIPRQPQVGLVHAREPRGFDRPEAGKGEQ